MTWTPPQHVTSGEASSTQFNAETVDNLLDHETRILALPRGVKGTPVFITSASQALTTSFADLSGVAVTFTAEAGRRYLIVAHAMFDGRASPGYYQAVIARGTTCIATGHVHGATAGGNAFVDLTGHDAPGAGSVTYKVKALVDTVTGSPIWTAGPGATTGGVGTTGPTSLIVMDVGPS